MKFVNAGLGLVVSLAMMDPVSHKFIWYLAGGYIIGYSLKMNSGPCNLSAIYGRRAVAMLVSLLAVLYSTGDLRTTVYALLTMLVLNKLADDVVNNMTRSMCGNLHINILITISVGIVNIGNDMIFSYFLSGTLLGYCVSVLDVLIQEVNSKRRRE